MDYKKYNINGLINLFRLENDNKIIYLFGDSANINMTKCIKNYKNIDSDNFFIKFLESYKNEINFFIPSTKNNFIYKNKNIKFYYFNVVDFNYYNLFIGKYYNNFDLLFNELQILIDDLDILINKTHEYINFNKNLFKFDNLKIQNIFNNLFIKLSSDVVNDSKEFKEFINLNINELNKKNNYNIQKEIYYKKYIICNKCYILFNIINVLHLINIILSNDTINKSIIYCDYNILLLILLLLNTEFNYKITNRFFSDPFIDNNSLDGLNKIIKALEYTNYESYVFLYKYLSYTEDNHIINCINLNNFPNNFS